MDETIAWLQDQPYYRDQNETHRIVPSRIAYTDEVNLATQLENTLVDHGITTFYYHQA